MLKILSSKITLKNFMHTDYGHYTLHHAGHLVVEKYWFWNRNVELVISNVADVGKTEQL